MRAIDAAVSASMLSFVAYCSSEHLEAGLELALVEHAVVLERLRPSGARRATAARRASSQVRQPALLGLLVPLLGVVVAVEDDLLVGAVGVADDGDDRLVDRACRPSSASRARRSAASIASATIVFSTVFGKRERHARAERAELELVAGEGERPGPVAVAAVLAAARGSTSVPRPRKPLRRRGVALAGLDRVEDLLELGAEEDRDDRRRRLVGAQAVVLADVGDRGAQQRLVLVDGREHRGAEEQELEVLVRRVARARAGCRPCRCPSTSCCACPSR